MNQDASEHTTLPPKIIIRKSKLKFILHSAIAILGFALVVYTSIADREGFTWFVTLFLIIFGGYIIYALRGLSDRSMQITIDHHSISFKDGTTFKWSEIKHVSIERKDLLSLNKLRISLGKGRETSLEQYYLKIETSYSGQVTGYRTAKFVEITNLEYTPGQIVRLIEQYKRKYR